MVMGTLRKWFGKAKTEPETTTPVIDEVASLKEQILQLQINSAIKDTMLVPFYQETEILKNNLFNTIYAMLMTCNNKLVIDSVFIELVQDPNFDKKLSVIKQDDGSMILELVDKQGTELL